MARGKPLSTAKRENTPASSQDSATKKQRTSPKVTKALQGSTNSPTPPSPTAPPEEGKEDQEREEEEDGDDDAEEEEEDDEEEFSVANCT
jgi:hypothetical protein